MFNHDKKRKKRKKRKMERDGPMLLDTTFGFEMGGGGSGMFASGGGVEDPVSSSEQEEMFSADAGSLASEREVESLFGGGMGEMPTVGMQEDEMGRGGRRRVRESTIRENRTDSFELGTGRFRDPSTGEFEEGGAPPDYDAETNRYRGKTGRFKARSADLYDEPEEVRRNSLEPEG